MRSLRTMGWLVLVLASGYAFAQSDAERQAREELERELKSMMGNVPTKLRLDFVGLDEPGYTLEEASFEVDGKTLKAPPTKQLDADGAHLVFHGDVAPGTHKVTVQLLYSSQASFMLSDEGGYKWKVGGSSTFELRPGIEVQLRVTPARDGKKPLPKRFTLTMPATPVMLAALDDGSMPEPPPKPKLPPPVVVEAVVDAGAPVAVAAPPVAPAVDPKQKAADERAAKLAEAAAAKQKAAEERAAKLAEAAAAKQKAAEERAAKLAEARLAPAKATPTVAEQAQQAQQQAQQDEENARAAEVARVAAEAQAARLAAAPPDAGPAVVAAVTRPPAPTPEPSSSLFPILAGVGAGGLFIAIVLFARRRAQVPKLEK